MYVVPYINSLGECSALRSERELAVWNICCTGKPLPPKVLIFVNVYTGNDLEAEQGTHYTRHKMEIKYTLNFSVLRDTSKL